MVRRILAAVLAILLVSQSVAADVVALRDGRQFSGLVLNRAQVKRFTSSVTSVYYQAAPTDSVHEFPRSLVKLVVLEDSTGHRETIALADTARDANLNMVSATPPVFEKRPAGLGWLLGGAALLLVGSTAKWGEDPDQAELPPIAREQSYNWVNYLTMGVGAGMMIAGVGISRRAPGPGEAQSSARLGPAEPTVAVSIHF
jgi:hypothetical protein